MPTLDITDAHRDRIETLREELAAAHAGAYASVDTDDALAYLLDLADAVDDPDRTADPEVVGDAAESGTKTGPGDAHPTFDRDAVRERLDERNRRHGDPDDADEMDLYAIAAAFDVAGRSDMTKAALIDAILDAAETLAADPFSRVDIDLDDDSEGDIESDADGSDTTADDGGSGQLNAMMSLLDTHDDKWREGDGDVRYEVDLPDGTVEAARTKDDVRALLFKNY
ncbi:hypothetical protein C461_09004 [Halorubrum aidingense JCM 13560]|uniref:Rho termination factor N-terminal domain-containing protein n=1 Tax=Halorubrum aidingense JCM 13560 TaxID=1230454 RepID=M0PE79_9EURY|nr:hypothetical protein [Halorubrum aidingense]EMA67854.1 hypothetical protein C461_09004 [Halorubrum aidingense JCM 13560]